jgi:hypothetical protein
MSKAIRAHNLGPMVAILLLAALIMLVVLVYMVRQAKTTTDRIERLAISADRAKGSNFDRDPYIDRHAEVVARCHHDGPR